MLSVLHEMFPEAPIYTAFYTGRGTVAEAFKGAEIRTSWANFILKHGNLHSPLRFLIPLIWESFNFSKFDLVILSSSAYVTKPIRVPKGVKVICYCHTPPRYIWGYDVSAEWSRYPILKIGSEVVAHFMRMYDFLGAKRVNQFIANSQTVKARIWKHYRKEAVIVYPPVDVKRIQYLLSNLVPQKKEYFLVVSRVVGGKGIPMIMEAANKIGARLIVAGKSTGLQWESRKISAQMGENIEFVGEVNEEEKFKLMAEAKAFIVAEKNVDFGITPVEAMAVGTPVVAYKSGGYLETIVEGKTGTFFEEYNADSLAEAMKKISKMKIKKEDCQKQAEKFSKERFVTKIQELIRELR